MQKVMFSRELAILCAVHLGILIDCRTERCPTGQCVADSMSTVQSNGTGVGTIVSRKVRSANG